MNATRFLDTNILLYAYDQDAPAKRSAALRLVEQGWSAPGQTAISVQVLQEMHVNLERRGVAKAEAAKIIRDYASWPVVDNSLEILLAALNEQARRQISLWDALILTAARASGAREIYTEDFNHAQDYGGIRAINPFR
jgi:predicted nucleic acid-binding protein